MQQYRSYFLNTWLFTPSSVEKFYMKLLDNNLVAADVVIFDFEDGINQNEIESAFDLLRKYWNDLKEKKFLKAIRLKNESCFEIAKNLYEQNQLEFDFIIIPKWEDIALINTFNNWFETTKIKTQLVLMIETKKAIADFDKNLAFLNSFNKAVYGILIGSGDLSSELEVDVESELINQIKLELIAKTKLANLIFIDAPFFDLTNLEELKKQTQFLKKNGVFNKTLISPKHIEITKSTLGFSEQEIKEFEQIVELARSGASVFKGKMVDEAFAKKARKIIEAYKQLQ